MTPTVTWPLNVGPASAASTRVPTAPKIGAPPPLRTSQKAPLVIMLTLEPSPETANGSRKPTFAEIVAVAGPAGEVLR